MQLEAPLAAVVFFGAESFPQRSGMENWLQIYGFLYLSGKSTMIFGDARTPSVRAFQHHDDDDDDDDHDDDDDDDDEDEDEAEDDDNDDDDDDDEDDDDDYDYDSMATCSMRVGDSYLCNPMLVYQRVIS